MSFPNFEQNFAELEYEFALFTWRSFLPRT